MRTTIAESIVNTVTDLNDSGLIDEITMKNIHPKSYSRLTDVELKQVAGR